MKPLPNLENRIRALKYDQSSTRRTRVLFGLDFMFVILLLICALYFVWPLMFKEGVPTVPVSDIREVYSLLGYVKDQAAGAVRGENAPEKVVEALKNSPAMASPIKMGQARIYIVDASGRLLLGNSELPSYWNEIQAEILTNQRSVLAHQEETESSILFYDTLSPSSLKIVVEKIYTWKKEVKK